MFTATTEQTKTSNLVYDNMKEAIKKKPFALNPPLLRELALSVDAYIQSEHFPNSEDKGTKEQWKRLKEDAEDRAETAEEMIHRVTKNMPEKKEVETPFAVKCITAGLFCVYSLFAPFGRFYNEEGAALRKEKDVIFIYVNSND